LASATSGRPVRHGGGMPKASRAFRAVAAPDDGDRASNAVAWREESDDGLPSSKYPSAVGEERNGPVGHRPALFELTWRLHPRRLGPRGRNEGRGNRRRRI
jgi:hypothetical protein